MPRGCPMAGSCRDDFCAALWHEHVLAQNNLPSLARAALFVLQAPGHVLAPRSLDAAVLGLLGRHRPRLQGIQLHLRHQLVRPPAVLQAFLLVVGRSPARRLLDPAGHCGAPPHGVLRTRRLDAVRFGSAGQLRLGRLHPPRPLIRSGDALDEVFHERARWPATLEAIERHVADGHLHELPPELGHAGGSAVRLNTAVAHQVAEKEPHQEDRAGGGRERAQHDPPGLGHDLLHDLLVFRHAHAVGQELPDLLVLVDVGIVQVVDAGKSVQDAILATCDDPPYKRSGRFDGVHTCPQLVTTVATFRIHGEHVPHTGVDLYLDVRAALPGGVGYADSVALD
mmetsp:Transcript_16058/g.36583  ORF Transcript_16058/g.36583 Transcript_16058/m.36583 type:complete len:339 (+) Transcript_16058:46-1062(+)